MSGPQPWPGPHGKPVVPPAAPAQPAAPPTAPPQSPPMGQPAETSHGYVAAAVPAQGGTGKIIAWTVTGTLLLGAIVVAAIFAANVLWGTPNKPDPLAGVTHQEQSAFANPPQQDAPDHMSAPQEPAEIQPQAEPEVDNSGYSNADKAYCKWQGKVVFVAASDSFRAAICEINGETTYLGLDKKAGTTIVLPATKTTNSATARNGNYSYALNAASFKISANNDVLAEEKMLTWWTPSAPELRLPGDLGLSQPISYPACNGSGVIVLATSFNPDTNAATIEQALQRNPGSRYLRTDLSCDNFRGPSMANSNGHSIYAVVLAVPGSKSAVCDAMAHYDATGEWLENGVDPSKNITCP